MRRKRCAIIVLAFTIAGCGASVSSTPSSLSSGTAPSVTPLRVPSKAPSSATAPPSTIATADIVGSWSRIQSCEEQLAQFEAAGLAAAEAFQWVTQNWVADPSPRTSGYCNGAAAPMAHTHFFTADGAFGSRDQNGQQVDDGRYAITSPGVISFPPDPSGVGYKKPLPVKYTITGNAVTFEVDVPAGCIKDTACADAYGWALSAFFKGPPWTRS